MRLGRKKAQGESLSLGNYSACPYLTKALVDQNLIVSRDGYAGGLGKRCSKPTCGNRNQQHRPVNSGWLLRSHNDILSIQRKAQRGYQSKLVRLVSNREAGAVDIAHLRHCRYPRRKAESTPHRYPQRQAYHPVIRLPHEAPIHHLTPIESRAFQAERLDDL